MIGLWLWVWLAQAQEEDDFLAADLHGAVPPLGDGDAASPVVVRSAPRLARGAWRVGALMEVATSPATLYTVDGGQVTEDVLLGDLVGGNLGASYAFGSRLGVEVALPLFWVGTEEQADGSVEGSTLTAGDVHLRVPIGLVGRDDGQGFALGLVPYGVLPTGDRERQLGSGGGAGLWALAGHRVDRWGVELGSGIDVTGQDTAGTQQVGGVQIPLGAALSVRPIGNVWVGAEARLAFAGNLPVDLEGAPAGRSRTGEALLSVRGDLGGKAGGMWAGAAGGTAVGRGPGSAPFRGFVGASFGDDGREDEALAPDVVTGPVAIDVVEANGRPAVGARVLADGVEVARTDATGRATVPGEYLWPAAVQVVVAGRPAVDVPQPADATVPVVVALAAEARPVDLRVTDLEGAPVIGVWTATSESGAVVEGRTGPEAELALVPGLWTVRLEAPGRAPQERSVLVDPTGPSSVVEAVLAPAGGTGELSVNVVDATDVGLGGARILLDGLPVGTTASGGAVVLGGLEPGDHTLLVEKVGYTPVERTVSTDVAVEPVVLAPVPGTVRVRVVGPDGAPATDAMVRFLGPSRLPTVEVDPSGERVQVLGPGDWSVVVTSPTLGGQARALRVAEDQTAVQVVDVVLLPSEGGLADLEVGVIDGKGRSVDGVEVRLGGFALGTTGSGGRMRVDELAVGARTLDLASDLLEAVPTRDLVLVEGLQEVVVPVRYRPGAVQVRGTGPDGGAIDGTLRLLGADGASMDFALGDDGVERFVLPAGSWTLYATSSYGTQVRELVVDADTHTLQRVDLAFRPSEGGLAELVVQLVDGDGLPVVGAAVGLDGYALGTTGLEGSLRIDELAVGSRELTVDSGLHRPVRRAVRLMEGELVVEETLDWAPGATRIRVRGPDGAVVPDALVRVLGPQSVPMGPVDEGGDRTVMLGPGTWQALASSPTLGVGLVSFEVPPAATDLMQIDVPVEASDGGLANLVLRVVDGDGTPVVGAEVDLDGSNVGRTGDGGVLKVDELRPAAFRMVVRHPDHPPTNSDLVLPAGVTDRIVPLAWALRPVVVTVQDDEGRPVDAEVQWRGPADMVPTTTNASGQASTLLRPGDWQALVAGGELGPGRVDFVVDDGPVDAVLVLGLSRVEVSAAGIAITEQVLFDFDAATLRPEARPVLDQVASALLATGAVVRVEVQGHSDATGDPAYNQSLSEDRARSVLEALVERGVPVEVLSARGYGPQRPVGDNGTPDGRRQNRRVQFDVLERGLD